MKNSKIAATIGFVIVAAEVVVASTIWTSDDPQFLADHLWTDVVPTNILAVIVELLLLIDGWLYRQPANRPNN